MRNLHRCKIGRRLNLIWRVMYYNSQAWRERQ